MYNIIYVSRVQHAFSFLAALTEASQPPLKGMTVGNRNWGQGLHPMQQAQPCPG